MDILIMFLFFLYTFIRFSKLHLPHVYMRQDERHFFLIIVIVAIEIVLSAGDRNKSS